MESQIPLPTDNIYKFYAFFGLLLLISSILGAAITMTSITDRAYALVQEYATIVKAIAQEETHPLHLQIVELQAKSIGSQLDLQNTVLTNYLKFFILTGSISFILLVYGFGFWHIKVQPKQDEYFDLQIQKLKIDIENSNRDREPL